MKTFVRALVVSAVVACTTPLVAESQTPKIPNGTYTLVADSGFTLDVPLASITLVFADSILTANVDGQMVIRSRLTQAGDQLTMTDLEGEMACAMPATYKVEERPAGLRLTPLEDMCTNRSSVLAGVTLVKI